MRLSPIRAVVNNAISARGVSGSARAADHSTGTPDRNRVLITTSLWTSLVGQTALLKW